MMIKIHQLTGGVISIVEVPAEPVSFKGYEVFSFFVNQDPAHEDGTKYTVTEETTGRRLCAHQETKEKAVKACAEFLKTVTPQKLGERIAFYLLGLGGA